MEPLSRRLKFISIANIIFALVVTGCAYGIRGTAAEYLIDDIDTPMHYLGGFMAAMGIVVVLFMACDAKVLQTMPKLIGVLCILGFVALVALAWEVLEYFSDRYLGTFVQLSIADTLKDMVVGLVGALPVALAWQGKGTSGT